MPWPPVIGIVLLLILLPFIIYELGLEAIGIGTGNEGLIALGVTAIWMVLGLVIYYGYSAGKEEEKLEEEAPTVLTERSAASRETEIVVPIANPESVEPLLRTALDLARDRDAEIHVISVVTVPQQTPLDQGEQFVDEQRQVLDQAISFVQDEDADVPVKGTIRIGHDVAKAILNTVEQYDSEFVLMGWRGQRRRRDFVLGSNLDEVVTKASCDVLVEKIGPVEEVETILLPTAGGPHSEFAVEIAQAIARTTGARIDVVRVIDPSASDEERAAAEELLDATTGDLNEGVVIEQQLFEGTDVADTIVERSADYDMTIIGATREGLLDQLVFGAIPEAVGRRAENTVIMAKRNLGITSRLTRWLGNNGS
jgi:nucleotide-binding universal stress UspA family protein